MAKASAIISLLLGIGLTGCYVTRQAWHQGGLLTTRRPVSEVVNDPQTTPETRAKLERTQSILAYAAKEQLNTEGAYDYFIQTQDPVVSYLVQAAEADKLQFVTWWFPVVGSVPYLGFFQKVERDEEAIRLRAKGYDVTEGGAGAFSSLGWFNDPIFSSMLVRKDSELAHLFFHELTHRTVWIPNAAAFNENLAEYVAAVLTRQYLTDHGESSALANYEIRRQDKDRFNQWLRELKADLERLYEQDKLPKEKLLKLKADIFAEYQKSPRKPKFRLVDFVRDEVWNNASVLSASLYTPDTERFDLLRKCIGQPRIRVFLNELKSAVDTSDGDLAAATAKLCPNLKHPNSKHPTSRQEQHVD